MPPNTDYPRDGEEGADRALAKALQHGPAALVDRVQAPGTADNHATKALLRYGPQLSDGTGNDPRSNIVTGTRNTGKSITPGARKLALSDSTTADPHTGARRAVHTARTATEKDLARVLAERSAHNPWSHGHLVRTQRVCTVFCSILIPPNASDPHPFCQNARGCAARCKPRGSVA